MAEPPTGSGRVKRERARQVRQACLAHWHWQAWLRDTETLSADIHSRLTLSSDANARLSLGAFASGAR